MNDDWWYDCPNCGNIPDVQSYLRDNLGARTGYVCGCGATVVDGVVQK